MQNIVYAATMENMEVSQKNKNRVALQPSNPIPGPALRQSYNSKRYTHPMFTIYVVNIIAALFTKTKTCKQPQCPSQMNG